MGKLTPRKPPSYNKDVKNASKQLEQLQLQLQLAQQEVTVAAERAVVLADMLQIKERLAAAHARHVAWLEQGGPSAADLALLEQLRQQMAQQHRRGGQPEHRITCLVEAASYEDVLLAINRTADDWRKVFHSEAVDSMLLLELMRRPREDFSRIVLAAASCCEDDADGDGGHDRQQQQRQQQRRRLDTDHLQHGDQQQQQQQQANPLGLLVQRFEREGVLCNLGMLHGSMAMMQASLTDLVTGRPVKAPDSHWEGVGQRLQLTDLQKLHCRLALEEYNRQVRKLASKGFVLAQMSTCYSLSRAAQTVQEEHSSKHGGSGGGSNSTGGQTGHAGSAAPPAGAADSGDGATTSGGRSSDQQSSGSAAAAAAAAAAASDAAQLLGLVGLDQELQANMAAFHQAIALLNIFYTDTLDLYQLGQLLAGSFPYWPMLPNAIEAAVYGWDAPQRPPGGRVLDADLRARIAEFGDRRRSSMARNLCWWEEQGVIPPAAPRQPGSPTGATG